MGKRGPKPTPTVVLAKRGSWRAGEERRLHEIRPKPTRPALPKWMSLDAKKIWRRLIPQLVSMGLLVKVDRQALARYCTMYAQWCEAQRILQDLGPVIAVKNAKGATVTYADRPEVARSLKLAERLDRLESKFGLTPSDRVGLQGDPDVMRGIAATAAAGKGRFFDREVSAG